MRGFIVVVADGGRDEKSKGEVGMGDLLLRTAVGEETVGDNVAEGGGG
jgi:hypothetical protein